MGVGARHALRVSSMAARWMSFIRRVGDSSRFWREMEQKLLSLIVTCTPLQ